MVEVYYKSKRKLKKEIGKSLDFINESWVDPEEKYTPDGTFSCIGIDHNFRATITMVDGIITEVR